MLYITKPSNFIPVFEIVACYCIYQNKILLLHRHGHKSEGDKWGIPAGKVESNETLEQAMVRELQEETELNINQKQLNYLNKYYVKYPDKHFIYHTFTTKFSKLPKINIAAHEHQEYQWITPHQALKLPLIKDENTSIKLTFGI
jgi:8-oxo-dGTP diphosphatase